MVIRESSLLKDNQLQCPPGGATILLDRTIQTAKQLERYITLKRQLARTCHVSLDAASSPVKVKITPR